MKKIIVLSFLFCALCAHSQGDADDGGTPQNAIPVVIDSLYREDQFYIGLSFNLLNDEPAGFTQNGFSGGLHLGFIRDMPFNKRRNKAIGIGLGWSTNIYNSNLVFNDTSGSTGFEVNPDRDAVDSNRFNTNLIELPIQYRWRTSTPTDFNFWRIYTGIKLGYLYGFRSKFDSAEGKVIVRNPDGLERWRYFATFTVGNGSFNAFVQYGLNRLFNDEARVENGALGLRAIKFGIEFYIL